MGGLSSILDRFRNVCGPYLFHNGFSTHPAKGKVVGAWSWQVVSMLNHWAFISAHLLFFSAVLLYLFLSRKPGYRSAQLCDRLLSSLSPPHGAAVLRVLMVCCRRSVGASTACSSGPWESNWEPRFGRPQECERCCTVIHLSLQHSAWASVQFRHTYDPNLAIHIQYILAEDKSTCKLKVKVVLVYSTNAYGGVEVYSSTHF